VAIVAIIPARYGSTRLPGKPLSDIHGKPMIQHVYERVGRARRPAHILVATDDERIEAVVAGFGGRAVLTSPAHPTGTDRLAEAVLGTEAEIVINVQGDEPLLDPEGVDAAVEPLLEDPGLPMATLSSPLVDLDELSSPAVVKVVTDGVGDALYFSRSPIPYLREASGRGQAALREALARGLVRKHVGLYAYRRDALLRLASLPPVPLEQAEELEQLRALHHGMRIRVVHRQAAGSVAVDTPQDLERVRALLARYQEEEQGCP
jgi:3-deoxy-manno-octulosonate cytidylyltransferase (CMP-KDO synthetase)